MNTDQFIVISYLIVTLILGITCGRKIKTLKQYAIGDRNISSIAISLTIIATLIGGGSSLGTATETFKYGVIAFAAKYGVSIGSLIIAYVIAPKMKNFFGLVSVGEIMHKMYGTKAQIITGIAGSLLCIGRMAAQILAFGYIANFFFGVDERIGIFLGSAVMILYSMSGGIKAVTYTDILQFIIVIVTVPVVLKIGLHEVGGYKALITNLPWEKRTIYPDDEMFRKYLIVFLYMALPLLSPPFVQRMLMSSNVAQIRKAFISMAIVDFTFTTISGLLGLIIYKLNPNAYANHALLELISLLLPVGIKGLVIIGIISVIMSTADSYLNMLSVSIVNDVIKPLNFRYDIKKELLILRGVTVIAGAFAVIIALYFQNIFELAIYTTNFWAPTIVAPLVLGIMGIRGDSRSFFLSLISGVTVFAIWELFGLKATTHIYSTIPSVLVSALAFVFMAKLPSRKGNSLHGAIRSIWQVLGNWYLKVRHFHLIKYCDYNVEKDGMPYQALAVFVLVNQIIGYFLDISINYYQSSVLGVITGLMLVALLLYDEWPFSIKRYYNTYWYIVLGYSLVFTPFCNLYNSSFSKENFIIACLSIFLLSRVVNWRMYLNFMYLSLAAIFVFTYNRGNIVSHLELNHIWLFYIIIFTITITVAFTKKSEEGEEARLRVAKEFGGIVAHEIKSPMISLFTNLRRVEHKIQQIGIQGLEPELKKLQDSGHYMSEAIDIMLKKMQGGQDTATLEEVSIAFTIQEICEQYQKGRLLLPNSITIIEQEDALVKIDKSLLKHVIYNILENALYYVKHKADGQVTISIKTDQHVLVEFLDNGIGIQPGLEEKVFRSYYTTRKNGTGLGLHLCKIIMRLHRGDIYCESKYGKYAKFILKFPIVAIREAA